MERLSMVIDLMLEDNIRPNQSHFNLLLQQCRTHKSVVTMEKIISKMASIGTVFLSNIASEKKERKRNICLVFFFFF
jgi:hypothetical protein